MTVEDSDGDLLARLRVAWMNTVDGDDYAVNVTRVVLAVLADDGGIGTGEICPVSDFGLDFVHGEVLWVFFDEKSSIVWLCGGRGF